MEFSYFYPTEDLDLDHNRNNFIQNIAIFKFYVHCISLSLMFEISPKYNWYLNF